MDTISRIDIISGFHYDVAYLNTYDAYLELACRYLLEALRLLEEEPEYCYLVEQVILLEAFWERHPEQHDRLRAFVAQGRLAVAPALYVMPDMNHLSGEALFLQARLGMAWVREHLGLEPETCWIADCWGHHAQLPQILRQVGYDYYVFWRCMRREGRRSAFRWQGLDGTCINTHWLPRGYGNIDFPAAEALAMALDPAASTNWLTRFQAICQELSHYGPLPALLVSCCGDFVPPPPAGPETVRRLNALGVLPPAAFTTPGRALAGLPWEAQPVVSGEFNSAFQGSFTSHIRIKQANRRLTNRLLALETFAVLQDRPCDMTELWKPVLKQQFHDIICGTISDAALEDHLREVREVEERLDAAFATLAAPAGVTAVCNTLGFPRTEVIEHDGQSYLVELPALGAATLGEALPARETPTLPLFVETDYYRAAIDEQGYLTSLLPKPTGEELIANHHAPFGSLTMQLDYGDLWLNFASPLNGGSREAAFTQNHADPFDRSTPESLAFTGTILPGEVTARCLRANAEELIIEQTGRLHFWQLKIPFTTRIRFARQSARIDYCTEIHPSGKHYRLRVAFPTAVTGGQRRDEIAFGIQPRDGAEYPVQHWLDYADDAHGVALLNTGTPGCSVDDGVLLMSLFRAAAMEYKAPSTLAFAEGVPHTFRYAILPHGAGGDARIVREGLALNTPPFLTRLDPARLAPAGWGIEPENVIISALRHRGDALFLRLYEATGHPASGHLTLPAGITAVAPADGQERPSGPFVPCAGTLPITLRPFEIQGFLFKR